MFAVIKAIEENGNNHQLLHMIQEKTKQNIFHYIAFYGNIEILKIIINAFEKSNKIKEMLELLVMPNQFKQIPIFEIFHYQPEEMLIYIIEYVGYNKYDNNIIITSTLLEKALFYNKIHIVKAILNQNINRSVIENVDKSILRHCKNYGAYKKYKKYLYRFYLYKAWELS